MRRLLFALGICTSLFGAANVRADDSGKPLEPTVVTKKSWYGWQPLSCDAVSATLFATSIKVLVDQNSTSSSVPGVLATGGLGFYLLGGPVVHLAHGHLLRALGDLGMRSGMAGFPFLLAAAATSASGHQRDPEASNSLVFFAGYLAVFGAAGAVAIDATIMSRERKRVVREEHAARPFFVSPDFAIQRGGGTLGLHGSF